MLLHAGLQGTLACLAVLTLLAMLAVALAVMRPKQKGVSDSGIMVSRLHPLLSSQHMCVVQACEEPSRQALQRLAEPSVARAQFGYALSTPSFLLLFFHTLALT